mgnify:CR=1 FL=1
MAYTGKIKINYNTACVGLGILFVMQKTALIADTSFLENIIDFLQWPLLLYIVVTLNERWIKKSSLIRYLIVAMILILFLISYRNSGLANIFKYTVLIIAASKNKDFEIFRKFRDSYLVLVLTVFVLGLFRILPSRIVRRGYFTYGFIHSNVLAMFVFAIICCDIICNYKKISFWRCGIYTVVMVLVITITDCRSVAVGFLSMLLLLIVFKINDDIHKSIIIKILVAMIPILLAILSFYVAYSFDFHNPLMLSLNKISSERLYLANQLTRFYSLTLLGQNCSDLLMENSYITVFFAWGIIPGIITLMTYCYAIYNSITKKAYGISICLLAFAVQGVFEGSTFELFENLSLLATFMI